MTGGVGDAKNAQNTAFKPHVRGQLNLLKGVRIKASRS